MKKVLFAVIIMTGLLQACSNNPDSVDKAKDANEKKDSTAAAMDTSKTMTAMPVDKDAADFAVEAANGGMMEVDMGKYAAQNGMSARVKDFGAMMVKDHSNLNDEMKKIAAAKNITLPISTGDDAKKEMDKLMQKKGKDFDKAYMDMMLDDHKKDISAFEKTAKDCKDPEIKSFAENALPTLRRHLDSAKAITMKK